MTKDLLQQKSSDVKSHQKVALSRTVYFGADKDIFLLYKNQIFLFKTP